VNKGESDGDLASVGHRSGIESDESASNIGLSYITQGGKTMTATSKPAPQRKSKQCGVGSELSVFFKVKPGQGSTLRQQLAKWDVSVSRADALNKTTLSDTRFVVFDNDTRCLFATNFDGPWDAYVEDVVRFFPAEFYDEVFGYFEGYPEAGIKSVSLDDIKKLINDNQVTASAYSKRYTDVTVKEIDKALRLQKAFQKVLDTPGADKALEHPALKPLLAEAAD